MSLNQNTGRPFACFDLDGTLLDTARKGIRSGKPSFLYSPSSTKVYETRLRPSLINFLSTLRKNFDFAVFTAAPQIYAEAMINGIDKFVPGFKKDLRCVFTQNNTTIIAKIGLIKDLYLVSQYCDVPLCHCFIVDDTLSTYYLNPSQALPIPSYQGSKDDNCLEKLLQFLVTVNLQQDLSLDVSGYFLAPCKHQITINRPDR